MYVVCVSGTISSISEMPPGLMSMGSGIQVDQTHVSSRGLQNTHSETKDGQTTITISDATQQLIFKHIGDQNTSNILQNSNWAGFMKKRGRINKTWTTRLFVLKGSLLTYYEAEEHPSIKVIARKGEITIAGPNNDRQILNIGAEPLPCSFAN